LSYPSGHSAYATTYIVLAVIATRVIGGLASRTAVVVAGILVTLVVGATRIYLRAHYLSDVIGGYGLGLAIFGGCAAIALVVGFIRQHGQAATDSPRA
jgi:undecaprenyl-diphosphatase